MNEKEEDGDMLDKIYSIRQCDFEKESNEDRKKLLERLNSVTQEEIEKIIGEEMTQKEESKKVIENLDKLIENYEIKMAYYMEKRYKQGFKDAMNLYIKCMDSK